VRELSGRKKFFFFTVSYGQPTTWPWCIRIGLALLTSVGANVHVVVALAGADQAAFLASNQIQVSGRSLAVRRARYACQ